MHFTFETLDDGFDVFAPVEGCWGYRYAPSINYYDDGHMTALFATPGTLGEWDWFTYKESKDRIHWSEEKVALQPTPDSMDHYSVCDPGLIYFNGYYYLGYTSTIVATGGGINNNVFVARAKSPDGPYEKWNGDGWGGNPQCIVYFDGMDSKWGAGEPTFVVVDNVLYMYFTWACKEGNFEMVCTADATSENWPETLEFKGKAYDKGQSDQFDVVYVEDTKSFLGVCTEQRFTENSGVRLLESNDGIHFEYGDFVSKNICKNCHNMGISKRPDGHVRLSDKLMIGYAYCAGAAGTDYWGKWPTRFQNIKLIAYDGDLKITSKGDGSDNVLRTDYYWKVPEKPNIAGITVLPHVIRVNMESTADFGVYWVNADNSNVKVEDIENIEVYGYDEDVVTVEGCTVTPKAPGRTMAKVTYAGCTAEAAIYVYDKDFEIHQENPTITEFVPVYDNITVYMGVYSGADHHIQIRGLVEFSDDTWGEAYNDRTSEHPAFPPMVPAEKYLMTFDVADDSIIDVTERGMIMPKKYGETDVTVTITGGKSFTVHVTVAKAPEEV